jgi:putative membrane protein
MALLVLILALEMWPMITLIRWRVVLGRGGAPATVAPEATARRIGAISFTQAALVVLMVCAAVGMARGFGTH